MYLIWINQRVIYDHPEPYDFIETNNPSFSIFICVRRQTSGNLHTMYQVLASTKRIHAATATSQIMQPKIPSYTKGIRSGVQLCTRLRPRSCEVLNAHRAEFASFNLLYINPHPSRIWRYNY